MNAQTLPSASMPLVDTAPPPAPARPTSAAAALLDGGPTSTWTDDAARVAIASSLAALFGLALGLRRGGFALAWGAAGAPLGILAVVALAAPALAIWLGLANAPVGVKALSRATSRAAAKAGLFLAGVAPATALFVVTVEDAITITIVGFGALTLAGAVAAQSFRLDLAPVIAGQPGARRTVLRAAVGAFVVFSAVLALRVWWLGLPMLTRAT